MKFKTEKRKNGTTRYMSIPHGASKTDQSDKNMVNINTIMANYAKTGLLPQFPEKIAQYVDTTQIPSYMEAQEQIRHASELFNQLPSKIRKDMDNNPANLETYITNPENQDLLFKYGIIEKKVDTSPKYDPTKTKSASAQKETIEDIVRKELAKAESKKDDK